MLRSDLWVIAIYLLGMMGIGCWVSSGARDVEGFTVGNRALPSWAVGMSVLGTFLSSITFLALPAKTYAQGNWNAAIFGFMPPVAAAVAVVYFVPLYRRRVRLSAYEFLEQRFGYWARAYGAIANIALQLIRIGTVLLLVALAVEPMLQWATPEGWDGQAWQSAKILGLIGVCGIVVIIYDLLGGIQAVVWTDVAQVVVLTVGAVWVLVSLMVDGTQGPREFVAAMPLERLEFGRFWNWDAQTGFWDWGATTVLVTGLYGLTENLRNYGTDQNYVQRMLCVRDDAAAIRSLQLGAWGYVPLNVVFCLIGTALWMHYHQGSGQLPEHLPADAVLPYYITSELPRPIAGLVIAAIMAAAMSTIDSSMNSCSMVALADLVLRWRRGPGWLPDIVILRLFTATLGILGTGVSAWLYLSQGDASRTVMDVWWQYAGTAGGGLFGLFLLAWWAPRLPAWGAALAVIATVPVLAWGTFARKLSADSPWKPWECPLHPNLVGITGTVAMLALAGIILLGVRAGFVAANPRAGREDGPPTVT